MSDSCYLAPLCLSFAGYSNLLLSEGSVDCLMSSVAANGSMDDADAPIVVGVLALQGAFREHIAHFNRLPGVSCVEVRTKEQLANLDGLVIPGGMFLLDLCSAVQDV